MSGGYVTALSVVTGNFDGLPALANQSIQIARPATKTVHGAEVADWSVDPVEVVTVRGCSVQSAGGSEDRNHRDQLGGAIHLFAPPQTSIGPLDRVWLPDYPNLYWRSATEPQVWAPGFLNHVQFSLVVWEG